MIPTRKVYTVKELAEFIGVHTSTIYRLLKREQLPAFKVGSDWRFNHDDIEVWRHRLLKKGGGSDET
jgi:excisionase family DNA binding protein